MSIKKDSFDAAMECWGDRGSHGMYEYVREFQFHFKSCIKEKNILPVDGHVHSWRKAQEDANNYIIKNNLL